MENQNRKTFDEAPELIKRRLEQRKILGLWSQDLSPEQRRFLQGDLLTDLFNTMNALTASINNGMDPDEIRGEFAMLNKSLLEGALVIGMDSSSLNNLTCQLVR